mmetsp:Transcript_31246/g.69516  ORF Transcript_31246/g.69516 Transcript_31246/m.69516 type:complete len:277 (+) Transcript_31246:295-1125(+)
MSLFDLLQRAQYLAKKYEKYDKELTTKSGKNSDPFMDEVQAVEDEIRRLMEAAQEVAGEKNRAAVAAKNAEIRRVKNVLLNDAVESLQKNISKGKRVTRAMKEERQKQVMNLIDRIYTIPDGLVQGVKRPSRYGTGKNDLGGRNNPVLLDLEGRNIDRVAANQDYYKENEQTQQFAKYWKVHKDEQDQKLVRIGARVDDLKTLAQNMGDDMDRQNPLIDGIDHQVGKITITIKGNNAKLRGLVHKLRSARNFCVDVILLVLLLAIGAYLYSMFAPK